MAATTFDPGRLTAAALSGGNLVWTSSGGNGQGYASRPLTGLSYAELVITTLTGTPAVGIVSQNWNGGQLGVDLSSIGYYSSGVVKFNNATLATLAAYVQGNRIGVAVDVFNKLVWFRVNGGNWNNNALNDPVTGVGGLSYAPPANSTTNQIATALWGVSSSLTGTVWTANFSGAFTDTAPTGYVTSDTQQITLARSVDAEQIFNVVADVVEMLARVGTDGRCVRTFSPAATITVVSGVTKEGGSPVGNKKVEVYDRVSGELLGCTYSDGSGNWSLPTVGRPTVRVVGSDPTTYNSVVFDNVPGV
jgi:hypothetical protein